MKIGLLNAMSKIVFFFDLRFTERCDCQELCHIYPSYKKKFFLDSEKSLLHKQDKKEITENSKTTLQGRFFNYFYFKTSILQ